MARIQAIGTALLALTIAGPVSAAPAPWRSALESFAHDHFRHPAWGDAHSRRDYALARTLAAEDGVALDDDVLFAAAMIHDIAAFAPWEDKDPNADHADVGAQALGPELLRLGFPAAKLDAVRAATRTHMFNRKAAAPEAVYLHDADALDWLGAIGVARILATVAHSEADRAAGDPDLAQALKAIEDNLASVPPGVQSRSARARLSALVAEAHTILARIRAEAGGDGNL